MTDAFIGGFDNFRREFQTYVGAELFKVVLGVMTSFFKTRLTSSIRLFVCLSETKIWATFLSVLLEFRKRVCRLFQCRAAYMYSTLQRTQ